MMKRFSLYIIIGVALLFAGCNKDNQDNGHLEGFWQMTEMHAAYFSSMEGKDMRESGLTWSFQGKLLELRDATGHQQDIVMSFEHKGSELRVYNPYFVERDSGDIKVTNAIDLLPYGISNTDDTFQVLELSSDKMVLSNPMFMLSFRKY